MAAKQEPLFYVAQSENVEEGPYDIIQMAGLLRRKMITGETPTRLEGEEHWQPFSWQPEFTLALEIPADAVSTRVQTAREEALNSKSPIPLPSAQFVAQAVLFGLALLIGGAVVFLLSWADLTMGICLGVAGLAIFLVSTCLIYVRLVDEDIWTLLMIAWVPFYDIFYFLSNLDAYLPYFCARYVGAMMVAAALAGILAGHAAGSEQISSFLR